MTSPTAAVVRLRTAAEVGELDDLCLRYDVRVLTVFGSAARGEVAPHDVDVGVLTEPGRPLDAEFGTALAAVAGIDEVDLVHLNRGGPVIRERALVGSIGLYESEPSALANAQLAAIGERGDGSDARAQPGSAGRMNPPRLDWRAVESRPISPPR